MEDPKLESLNIILEAIRQRDKERRERESKLSYTPTTVLFLFEEGKISEEEYKKYMLAQDDYQPKLNK